MSQPTSRVPSFVPLLQWFENNGVLPAGTVVQVNVMADKVKSLGDALKAGGITR